VAEQRIQEDRRKSPTPGLSRYTFFGRRRILRRRVDQEKGGYVDRYNSGLLFILVLILGLNLLDAFFTVMILDQQAWELNPIVRSVIQVHGDKFWIWKFALISSCLVLLCLHSKFKWVKSALVGISSVYLLLLLYEILLLIYS
jgi:hypothetical protein